MTPVALVVLLLGLPPLGLWSSGQMLAPYLAFPPVTRFLVHHPFSWPVFLGLCAFVIALTTPLVRRVMRVTPATAVARHPFPRWGGIGVAVLVCAWFLAWTRFSWFAWVQSFTFAPLWLGYVVVINALTVHRSGRSLLTHRPRFFLALYPLSAVFWWFFEYLNRFVQNWHYAGAGNLSANAYFWSATCAFATVLPAVLSTRDWLATFPRLQVAFSGFAPWRPRHPRVLAALLLLVAAAGLVLIGLAPDYLFPLLWVAPLMVVVTLQVLRGHPHVFAPVAHGDWRPVLLPAFAALVCGFFWEMWNAHSLAHWEYTLPFVDRFRIFEMPVLGYMGYLPFGVECVAFVSLFYPLSEARAPESTRVARAA